MSELKLEPLKTEYYPEWGFRPGTPMFPMNMNFIFMNGGMGDYICWVPAIQWLARNATWIRGNLICATYFLELAQYWLKDTGWGVVDYSKIDEMKQIGEAPFRGPVNLQQESLNATGAHLLTCGWVYFTNKEGPPPGYENYPELKQEDLDQVKLCKRATELKDYVVMTCGLTTNSRRVPGKYWNHVIEHIKSKGLTPVFLGKTVVETGNHKNVHTEWDQDLKFSEGVDLRDKTTLMQAAAIMSRAKAVVGHDNGLLHLAGCTEVPIVFGYNLALPEHRRPRRKVGKVYDVMLNDGELACYGCQSKTNFVIGYNFRDCFYADNKCIHMLFDNEAARWKKQIDLALG